MIEGSIVALVTPMTATNELDWDSLHNLVEWHIEKGSDSIVVAGTTGESATLSVGEHLQVIKRIVDQVNGRLPVVAGTGANATEEAVTLTAAAKEAGADACLLVTPYYNKPSQEGLFLHHQHIAQSVAIPQLLYNVPSRTGVDMAVDTVIRLSSVDNIIGVKEATGDLSRVRQILDATNDFSVLSGDDATAVELILLGGRGNISVTANVAPTHIANMCRLAMSGDASGARDLNQQLMPLHKALFVESNPIPVKWAVAQMGLIEPGIRLPLTTLAAHYHDQVRAAMDAVEAVGCELIK